MHPTQPRPDADLAEAGAGTGADVGADGGVGGSLLKRYLLPVGLFDEPRIDLFFGAHVEPPASRAKKDSCVFAETQTSPHQNRPLR